MQEITLVRFTVRSDLAVASNDALAEAGIEIPFPQRDLHVRSVGPEVRQVFADEAPANRNPESDSE